MDAAEVAIGAVTIGITGATQRPARLRARHPRPRHLRGSRHQKATFAQLDGVAISAIFVW